MLLGAKVEGAKGRLAAESGLLNLKFRHRRVPRLAHPRVTRADGRVEGRVEPLGFAMNAMLPVALAKEAEEEGEGGGDVLETEAYNGAVRRLLPRDAPPQVDRQEGGASRGARRVERGEHVLDKQVALGLEVAKGGGDEGAERIARLRAERRARARLV